MSSAYHERRRRCHDEWAVSGLQTDRDRASQGCPWTLWTDPFWTDWMIRRHVWDDVRAMPRCLQLPSGCECVVLRTMPYSTLELDVDWDSLGADMCPMLLTAPGSGTGHHQRVARHLLVRRCTGSALELSLCFSPDVQAVELV